MAITGRRGDGAERSLKPGGGQPDLLAKRDGFAVARPADVGRLPDIRTGAIANAVVQRCVDAENDGVHTRG